MSLNVRKRCNSEFGEIVCKKQCLNSVLSDTELEYTYDTEQCEHHHDSYLKKFVPCYLIGLMYKLDLAILLLLKMLKHKYQYQVQFQDYLIDRFADVVIYYEGKSIHILVENVDNCGNHFDCSKLFCNQSKSNINNLFNSFIRYKISKIDSFLGKEYMVIFTNGMLNVGKKNKSMLIKSKYFSPIDFKEIGAGEREVLRAILPTSDDAENVIYTLSQDKSNREELLKVLQFAPGVKKELNKKQNEIFLILEDELKEEFLNNFIFIVNQPKREELNIIVREEIQTLGVQYDDFQEKLLYNLKVEGKKRKAISCMHELSLLMALLHDIYSGENMFAINCEENKHNLSDYITICVKGELSYLVVGVYHQTVNYEVLFPSGKENRSYLNIKKYFINFVEELKKKKNIKHFIIYTNGTLDLLDGKMLRKKSKDFLPLKLKRVNIQKNKYAVLKTCSFFVEEGLFKFAKGKTRENILSLLSLPESDKMLDVGENLKEKFLDALLIAGDQFDHAGLNLFIRSQLMNCDVSNSYRYEELLEITVRWLESKECGPITKNLMETFLEDIRNNVLSQQEFQNLFYEKRIRSAKSVVHSEDTSFLQVSSITNDNLETMKRHGIMMSDISSILCGAEDGSSQAFIDLYDLLFDRQGNATQYLMLPQKAGISLFSLSSILYCSGISGAKAYKNLYDVLFDEHGHKTHSLKILEKQNFTLNDLSGILRGSRINAGKAFVELCELWFDEKGARSQYLQNLEREGIDLVNMLSILSGTGTNAANAFKELYFHWFDEDGNLKQYLKNLRKCKINLTCMSNILLGAGSHSVKAFKNLYDLWFDDDGNVTSYIKNLKDNGIKLRSMSNILFGAGRNAASAFKELYDCWFDEKGSKTLYLKSLEEFGISVSTLPSILSVNGVNAGKAFMDFYEMMFDRNGNKSHYLKTLEKERTTTDVITFLQNSRTHASPFLLEVYNTWMGDEGRKHVYKKVLEENGIKSNLLKQVTRRAGANSAKAFQEMYFLLFNNKGQKSKYLNNLQREGINFSQVSMIIAQAGTDCGKAFKELHDLWFDEEGNKTKYLTNLQVLDIDLADLCYTLKGSGVHAANTYKELYCFFLDENGYKSKNLKCLEQVGISVLDVLRILIGAGYNSGKALKELYSLLFDANGMKTPYLENLIKCDIYPYQVSEILSMCGSNIKTAFLQLYDLWIDEQGNRTKYLTALENAGLNLRLMQLLLPRSGLQAAQAFKKIYDVFFDKNGHKTLYTRNLEDARIELSNIPPLFRGVGVKFSKAFKEFYDFWFDDEGKKTLYLRRLEKEGLYLCDIANIFRASNTMSVHIFKMLYDLWFDGEGNKTLFVKHLEGIGLCLRNILRILRGQGRNATKVFNDLYKHCFCGTSYKKEYVEKLLKPIKKNCEKRTLSNPDSATQTFTKESKLNVNVNIGSSDFHYFIEKNFGGKVCELCNLSDKLKGENHTEIFAEVLPQFRLYAGEKMEILKVFLNANVEASDIICILHGRGVHFKAFKDLYFVFFSKQDIKRHFVADFFAAGVQLGDLCRMLSGAAENVGELHELCFVEKKHYLSDFVCCGFSPKILSIILHGCGAEICSSIRDFHDALFDEKGFCTNLLEDFLSWGFEAKYLSQLFAVTGSNASSVMKNFHQLFFIDKLYYLSNFLAEEHIFSPESLSKILYGCGIYVCICLKKLHFICFDRKGNKTTFLNNLLETNSQENLYFALNNVVKDLLKNQITKQLSFGQSENK